MATIRLPKNQKGTPLPNVQAFADEVERVVGLTSFGTYIGHSPSLERAVDVFVPVKSAAEGDAVCKLALANVSRFGVRYVIFRQRIWHRNDPIWRGMADRGDLTQNHFDHVHLSFEFEYAGPLSPSKPSDPDVPAFLGGPYGRDCARFTCNGDGVKVIQHRLVQLGKVLEIDGDYGYVTETAVTEVQRANGIGEDGVVGPITWRAMWKTAVAPPPPPPPPPPPVTVDRPALLAFAHTGFVLDVAGADQSNGAAIVQWPANLGPQQTVRLETEDGTHFVVRFAHSGKVLDHDPNAGDLVHQWEYIRGNANQLWKIIPVSGNIFGLQSVADDKVLDLHGISTEKGARLGVWTWHGGPNQLMFRNYLD